MSRAEMQAQTEVDWKTVVEQIQAGDAAGEEALYRNLVNGARLFLRRRLGTQDVEDRVHDLFIIVVETIRRGELREPERLMGFVRTVLHRLLNRQIAHIIASRETSSDVAEAENIRGNYPSPEDSVIADQKLELMKKILRQLSDRDFEILSRFYIRGQSPDQIRSEMALTETQFNLLKSRAKARFAQLVQRKITRVSRG